MNGTLGEAAAKVQVFADVLGRTTKVPLQFLDERLSTVQGGRQLHEAGAMRAPSGDRIDSEAATVLLQAYLDSKSFFFPPES